MTSGKFATTVGFERRFNPALQIEKRSDFVAFMNADQPVRPANMLNVVEINQGKRPYSMLEPRSAELTVRELADHIAESHLVIDTRSPADFGACHIPGSYNIQIDSPEFEQRIGWVTPLDIPIVLVTDSAADAQKAVHLMAFLGLDGRVKGHLGGGIDAWIMAGKEQATLTQISVYQLQEQLGNGLNMQVLDVRETSEWDDGHIANAHYMNYKTLRQNIESLHIHPNQHVSVTCARGLRSSTACSILQMHGYEHVYNLTGGMSAWKAAKLPMVK